MACLEMFRGNTASFALRGSSMACLEMFRGNTAQVTGTIAINGIPQDITGCTVWFTLKYAQTYVTTPDPGFLRLSTLNGGVVIPNPTNGILIATIPPAATAMLPGDTLFAYDWKLLDTYGIETTIDSGTLNVIAGVTQTT